MSQFFQVELVLLLQSEDDFWLTQMFAICEWSIKNRIDSLFNTYDRCTDKMLLWTGMRTEINKKRGRPSEHSKEAQAKGAKWGKNSWGIGGCCKPPPPQPVPGAEPRARFIKIGILEVYNCQKRNFLENYDK